MFYLFWSALSTWYSNIVEINFRVYGSWFNNFLNERFWNTCIMIATFDFFSDASFWSIMLIRSKISFFVTFSLPFTVFFYLILSLDYWLNFRSWWYLQTVCQNSECLLIYRFQNFLIHSNLVLNFVSQMVHIETIGVSIWLVVLI